MRVRGVFGTVMLLGGCLLAGCDAGGRRLSVADVFGAAHGDLTGGPSAQYTWLEDGEHYLVGGGDAAQRIHARTGESTSAYDAETVSEALTGAGVANRSVANRVAASPLAFSRNRQSALFDVDGELFSLDLARGVASRAESTGRSRRELSMSPDGSHATYVLDNDLHLVDLVACQTRRATLDGSEVVLNGILDWVYQEEVFGRGEWRGYWWSPDGDKLAFLQLDTSSVPVHPLIDGVAAPAHHRTQRYPRAGDPNPRPRLGVIAVESGETTWVDLSKYDSADLVIAAVLWSPRGELLFAAQNRIASWLELNAVAYDGNVRSLVRETAIGWVEWQAPPAFLRDGSFLWLSARDGPIRVFHVTHDGAIARPVSPESGSITRILGVDEDAGLAYLAGTLDTPLETHVYSVPLAGGDATRLTPLGATHRASMSPNCRYFIDTYSSVDSPPAVRLCDARGALVRVLSEGGLPARDAYALLPASIVQIPAPDGGVLNALIVRPREWATLKRCPVALEVYGAPGSPSVRNVWGGRGYLFTQLLAAEGYLACIIDPQIAGSDRPDVWQRAHGRLGELELADLEMGLHWLAEHEKADLMRVAIMGHSYGGFLSAYAATHSSRFAAAVAGSPVTDWRLYDSIYTERFMGLPAANADGYAASDVVAAAGRLSGRLLLAHGLADDNVHPTNSYALAAALRRAGKRFELFTYPDAGHGYGRSEADWHGKVLAFLRRTIGRRLQQRRRARFPHPVRVQSIHKSSCQADVARARIGLATRNSGLLGRDHVGSSYTGNRRPTGTCQAAACAALECRSAR